MRSVLHFSSIMKYIEFVIDLQGDIPKVLCSLFGKPVTSHEDNQGVIALSVAPQIQTRTKHIAIKYHHFHIFVTNGDVEIQHIETKEQITDIFTKPLDSELFGYLRYNINGW